MPLSLQRDVTEYVDKNGKLRTYNNLFVTVHGVKVQLKPADRTGGELINNFLDSQK